jgi:nucleoside phosphorylase
MKLAIITPISVEMKMAKTVLDLRDARQCFGCRVAAGNAKDVEIICIRSGLGKARAAQATMAAIQQLSAELILDTGTCAQIHAGGQIDTIIIGTGCFEFDINGRGIPEKQIKAMELPSAFQFLPPDVRKDLEAQAGEIGRKAGFQVVSGIQACGEYLVNSISMKKKLYNLFQAMGANWETAGVFISALRCAKPALSFRITSDLGDRHALKDFRVHAKSSAERLYQFISLLIEQGWFHQFIYEWRKLSDSQLAALPQSVLL